MRRIIFSAWYFNIHNALLLACIQLYTAQCCGGMCWCLTTRLVVFCVQLHVLLRKCVFLPNSKNIQTAVCGNLVDHRCECLSVCVRIQSVQCDFTDVDSWFFEPATSKYCLPFVLICAQQQSFPTLAYLQGHTNSLISCWSSSHYIT